MQRKWLSAAFGVALAVGVAAAAQAQEVLKIGGIGPLSGGGTAWGLAAQRGMEIAIEEINAAGGVKAEGKTYKLQLIMYDDQYTGQGGKAAAERLVNQDNVKFIIGPVGSPPALGVISVTNPAKVIALTDGYAPQILKNDTKDPYNFRIYPTNIEFGPPLIKWLKENAPEIKKVGLLAPNDAVGQSVAGALAEDYRKQGFEVVLDLFERGIKEFTPLILRMMAQKVDAFEFDGNSPGDAGLMLKQIRQAGFKGTRHADRRSGLRRDHRDRRAGGGGLPVLRHLRLGYAGRPEAAPDLREEIRQGHHQPVHAGLLSHRVPAGGRHQARRLHRHHQGARLRSTP